MSRFEQMPDESLMDFIRSGHDKAFEALLNRHHRRFYHMVYRWVLNAQDAEDIVQQAFLKLWSGQARWKPGKKAKFTTWFYRILYHQSIDRLRAKKTECIPLNESIAAGRDNQEQELADLQEQQKLRECLLNLPDNQRIAVQLFYFEALKQKEIASIMGLNIKALESQLTRARHHLRDMLDNPFVEEHGYVVL